MTKTPQIAALPGMSPLGIAPTPITALAALDAALDARAALAALDARDAALAALDDARVAYAAALALIAKTGGAA